MATPTTLAAVLFVELADFSDLLFTDERAALELLMAYRRAVDSIVAEHSGETVDATGSELLVVFSSAVAAVQCALHLNLALLPFAAAPGLERRAGARIGVHLGEIWRDSGKVYGNGVNVAARVMQAAPPGALFVSEDVYRQVSGKLDLSVHEVGNAVLKNIDRPLVLYEIDAGRGFFGGEASRTERRSSAPGARSSENTGDSARDPLHEEPHGSPQGAHPHTPSHLSHGTARPTSRLATELRDSITREVQDALTGACISRGRTGRGLTVTMGPGASGGPAEKTPARAAGGAAAPDDSETRREKASEAVARATKGLVMSGGIAAGLGYGYAATGKWPFALGAAIVVLAPFLANLKRLVTALSELRLIDRCARRNTVKD